MEKKPFYHILPGAPVLSIATAGCNFECKYCQNWEISQVGPDETYNFDLPPAQVVRLAKDYGCWIIAYTEPSVFYEYMLDTAKLARREGILNTLHSNGYLNPYPSYADTWMEPI